MAFARRRADTPSPPVLLRSRRLVVGQGERAFWICARDDRSDLHPRDCRRHTGQHHGVDAARPPLHSLSASSPFAWCCFLSTSLGSARSLRRVPPDRALGLCHLARRERFDPMLRTGEIVFLCALVYGAIWRWSFPEVVEDNDRLTDFHFVSNYLSGAKLRRSTIGSLTSGSTTTTTTSNTTRPRCSAGCSAWAQARASA